MMFAQIFPYFLGEKNKTQKKSDLIRSHGPIRLPAVELLAMWQLPHRSNLGDSSIETMFFHHQIDDTTVENPWFLHGLDHQIELEESGFKFLLIQDALQRWSNGKKQKYIINKHRCRGLKWLTKKATKLHDYNLILPIAIIETLLSRCAQAQMLVSDPSDRCGVIKRSFDNRCTAKSASSTRGVHFFPVTWTVCT